MSELQSIECSARTPYRIDVGGGGTFTDPIACGAGGILYSAHPIGVSGIREYPQEVPWPPVLEETLLPPMIVHPGAGGDSLYLSTSSG